MTHSPEADRERAETEAATWLVLLSEEPDDAELRAGFRSWHDASALNAAIWARTGRAYDLVGQAPARHADQWQPYATARTAESAQAQPQTRPSARPPEQSPASRPESRPRRDRPAATARRPRRLGRAALAAAALAACLLLVVQPGPLHRLGADHATATAELRSVTLADGTRVSLAPESALDVDFAGNERRVRLRAGEAFFEVAPDPSRPFRVTAGSATATVLGTAFDVRLGDGDTSVAVRHGHVRVDDDSASPPVSEHLRAGDWLRVAPQGAIARGNRAPDDLADWLRGELVARDRPAGEVVDELRRYYGGVILVRDEAFAGRRVSGIYDLRDPEATLRGLAASHGSGVRRPFPGLLIVTTPG